MPDSGPPTGADGVLRPALDLAFDVARIGARSVPPIEAPRAVRPFLQFTGRLPDGALGALRRGLDEDEGFRARVAGLADEDELGRAGWLLVVRPEGWDAELAGILDQAGAKARAEQEEKEERSARRRLAHAEQATERAQAAAARARAELAAAATELAAERRSRRAAQDDVARLTRKVDSLEGERDSARRRAAESAAEVAHLAAGLDAAQGEAARLGSALEAAEADAAARALRERAEQLRAGAGGSDAGTVPAKGRPGDGRRPVGRGGSAGPATGDSGRAGVAGTSASSISGGAGAGASASSSGGRAGTPASSSGRRAGDGPDLRLVADAVAAAAAAASNLGRALADASSALAPAAVPTATSPPSRTPRGGPAAARRRPAALPPAVFDDTTEAAAHLVRVPGALVLVDGYNAAKALWPDEAPLELRERLVDALSELVARTGAVIHVVYDGADLGMPPSRPATTRGVRVSFSPADVEADDVILDLVDAEPPARAVVVASSDHRVRDGARRRGANVITSAQLAAVLGRS